MASSVWLLVWVVAAGEAAPAPGKVPTRIGVFDVTVAGLEPAMKTTAIDTIAAAVGTLPGFVPLSASEITTMLGAETAKQMLGCDGTSCLAELGMAAGVERVIGGSLAAVEGGLVVNLQLVNTRTAATESRVSLRWQGGNDGLAEALTAAVQQLLLPAEHLSPGALRLSGLPAAAAVIVDGQPRGAGPITVEGLSVGAHRLQVQADGMDPYDRSFAVLAGQERRLAVQLVESQAKPFYSRWWFWGIAGVAVAGGATAGVLATRGSTSKGTLQVAAPVP